MIKLEDIAKLAGVSKAAVSLALNDKPGISEERRAEIKQIANEQNYIPLRKSKSNEINTNHEEIYTIRFVACTNDSFITNNYQSTPFFSELLQDLSQLSNDYKVSLIINSISLDNSEIELEELEHSQKSDGIILLGTSLSIEFIDKFIGKFPNTVIIDSCHLHTNYDYVSINNFHGAYTSTKYLINKGYKDIGYIKGLPNISNFDQRFSGYKKAMKDNNMNIDDNYIYSLTGNVISSEIDSINFEKLPSAFVCDNDYIAISLIKTLQRNGIRIPEDVSVIGFDNIPESKVISPELTTIEVNSKEIAKQCINKLINRLNNEKYVPSQILIGNELIIRNSTK